PHTEDDSQLPRLLPGKFPPRKHQQDAAGREGETQRRWLGNDDSKLEWFRGQVPRRIESPGPISSRCRLTLPKGACDHRRHVALIVNCDDEIFSGVALRISWVHAATRRQKLV